MGCPRCFKTCSGSVDWVLVFLVKRDAEAKSEGIQELWRGRRGINVKVVYFQVGGFGDESGCVEI
jgi:hypothetical protein